MILNNRFKAALTAKQLQLGLWLALASPYSAELCAGAGFDWLLLDGEHSPVDLRTLLSQMQALAAYSSHAVVRPPVGDPVLIKQLLDIGAESLLIPMVETAEQAAMLVSATRYPPQGIRGVGAGIARASRWGLVDDYLTTANDNICLLLQVETKVGLDNLDAILEVEGVDGIFLGASDLAASMGHLTDRSHPAVIEVMTDAIDRIKKAGKAPGVLTLDDAEARKFIDMGCLFVAVGVDTLVLAQGVRDMHRRFRGSETAAPVKSGY